MNVNKIFSIAVTICSTFLYNFGNTSTVELKFYANDYCKLMCDDQEYDFYSIDELSRNINSITKHYFTVDSVYKLNDLLTIGF